VPFSKLFKTFLALKPTGIIVTSLEADHLDIYKDLQDVRDTFLKFISKLKRDETLVLQGDDTELIDLARLSPLKAITYGLNENLDYQAVDLRLDSFNSSFTIMNQANMLGEITLNMPGKHNVLNALGACALCRELGIAFESIKKGLESFRGVERRFEQRALKDGVLYIDDYAHHPSELIATLAAARSGWSNSRIIAVFQPHLYSRTRDFAPEFAQALELADISIVTDIYPAREAAIPGVSSDLIVNSSNKIQLLHGIQDVYSFLQPQLKQNDLLITLGAGDIWKLHNLFLGEKI